MTNPTSRVIASPPPTVKVNRAQPVKQTHTSQPHRVQPVEPLSTKAQKALSAYRRPLEEKDYIDQIFHIDLKA